MYNLIFGPALFYDIPEYLNIVSHNSLLQVFSLGHFPIHPVFLSILWIFIKFFPVNVIAMLFGAYSIFLVNKISKIIFKKGFLPAIIFALFPGVWLINMNLMVESISLTFFILSVYFFLLKKPFGFFISLFLMIGTHLESIFWIPAIFILPFIFSDETKFYKNELIIFLKIAVASIAFSIVFYLFIYIFSGRNFTGSSEQLLTYFSSGILRMVRNSWLSFARGFGSLTIFLFIFLIGKYVRAKKEIISWILIFGLVFLIGANWQGDFMPRRMIFAGVFLALGFYKFLKNKSIMVIIYLFPITLANIVLYSSGSPFPGFDIPKGQILIQTFYLKPFTNYDGTILWLEQTNTSEINRYLESGKRVFLTKDAVTAPYRLLVGNNYHITSLGKVGESPARMLFQKYKVEPHKNYFELTTAPEKISKDAGRAVIFYDQSFLGRLSRRRIDYGDLGSWVWAIVLNQKDPTGWIYKDATGKIPAT